MSYTALAHVATGDVATAALHNTELDNQAFFAAAYNSDGSVLGPLSGYREKTQVGTIVSSSVTVDLTQGNHILISLNANIGSFFAGNLAPNGYYCPIILYFFGSGSLHTITWTMNLKAIRFPYQTPPAAMSSGSGILDIVTIFTVDNGFGYYATYVQNL